MSELLEEEKQLARRANKSASNDATLIWSLLACFLLLASFPLRWRIEFVIVPFSVAFIGSIVISGVVALIYYRKAHQRVLEAQRDLNELMKAKKARQREEHLNALRERNSDG